MLHRSLADEEATEEIQSLKNRLNIQDAKLAAQETRMMKQSELLDDCRDSLNDALDKLNKETQRNLELEQEFKRRTNEFQGQRVASQNVEMSLEGARNAVKEKETEVKDLESSLESVSRVSEEHRVRATKLEREKVMLEARVRELETEVQKKATTTPAPHSRVFSQPRPSTSSEDKIRVLEKELADTRSTLSQTEEDMRMMAQRFSQAQRDLVRLENERAAAGKQMTSRLTELTASLEEKEDELQLMKSLADDGRREDELIKRIEEDEAKIATLESMLRESQDVHRLKAQMKDVEARLGEETKKVLEREEQCIELVHEKEEALDELASAKAEIQRLAQIVNDRDGTLNSEDTRRPQKDCLFDSAVDSWPTTPLSQAGPDETTISYIERLLSAVDRLRSERDSLQRDIHFLESESRFTIESLEAKLSGSTVGAATNLSLTSPTKDAKTRHLIERSALIATANAVALSHLDFRNAQIQDQLEDKIQIAARQANRISDLENQLNESSSSLQVICCQRDDIQSQLAQRELQWEQERQRLNKLNQGTCSSLNELERQVVDLSRTLENVESERNSLSLQVTNLTSELQTAQQELIDAESRYTTLRFQQLSTMSTTEANRVLREQLKDMEMRVARRTEQIGIHQHDIRRLETNLRLQEERLSEMTAELETLAAQKDAMVEDCADAREARDVALSRVETLEMELESLETKLDQSDQGLVSLVSVFVQAISKSKDATKRARDKEASLNQESLSVNEAQVAEKNAVEMALAEVAVHHAQELQSLQQQLETTSNTLTELQANFASVEADKERMASDFVRIRQDLEQRVASMSTNMLQDSQAKAELLSLQREHDEQLSRLRDDLEMSRLDYERAHERVRELELSRQHISDELAGAREAQRAELVRITEEARVTKEKLEDDLTLLNSELNKNSRELQESSEEIKRLSQELQHLTEGQAQERQEYDQRIHSIETQRQNVASALEELKGRMDYVMTELTKSQKELEIVQAEKQSQQENMTDLEAELQRSASMARYLESQVKESEQTIAALTSECGALRAEVDRIEKSSKATGVNLSLQSAQHKREMAEVQRELDILRSKPDLAAPLAELEERNNEMEELLRQKCAEIEENDDRVLEMLKENKKLTAKVESLNRKVQNLQAKLSAAKASAPRIEETSSVPFPSSASPVARVPTVQPQASITTGALSRSVPAPGVFTDRSTTDPNVSSTLKPKTPERRLGHPTVFKAKSPEKRASVPTPGSEVTEQVIGKKRRAPDDFELGEGLPPQGFTIDSIPDEHNENRTPRVRRIISGGQTGFTPVRRSHTTQPSPKRASMASLKTSLIVDVTNSPRGSSQGMGKNTKRSWLGKIRGSSAPHTTRIVGTRTTSERPDELP